LYVCGDNSDTEFSGLALTAISHGNFLARDIKARQKGKKRPQHKDPHPIQVVPIGNKAILQYRRLMLHGRLMSLVRRAADFIGYSDILGPLKALTIWQNSERTEEVCAVCRTNK
jgi:NADH dehydrogenase FAD-containing subunit